MIVNGYSIEANADLTNADLRGADLTDADLVGAVLEGANLTDANLTRANLTDAHLKDADLTLSDVFPELVKAAKAKTANTRVRAEVAARYKDPSSGSLWSGRGRSPLWVAAILQARGINIKEFKQMSEFAA